MSSTLNQYTLAGAIEGTKDFLGPDRVWVPKNDFQRTLVERHFAGPKADLPALEELDLMETRADRDHVPLNELLARRGFSIQLNPFNPGEFGVVSILEMLVGWLNRGRRIKVTGARDNREYPAAHLSKNCLVEFYTAQHTGGRAIIAAVPAVFGLDHQDASKSGDSAPPPDPDVMVYMAPMDSAPGGFRLIELAMDLSHNLTPGGGYEGLIFPMVNLNHEPDIRGLIGLSTTDQAGRQWEVGEALQQNILKMNDRGALAKSATAIRMHTTCMPAPPLVINRPFLVWFEIPGMTEPVFVAHVTEEHFADPGDLA